MSREQRSVLDPWVDPDVRDKRGFGIPPPECVELNRQAQRIGSLPHGEREQEKERIAKAFGVSTRTVDRYRFPAQMVRLAGWEALYGLVPGKQPRRLTVWKRITDQPMTSK